MKTLTKNIQLSAEALEVYGFNELSMLVQNLNRNSSTEDVTHNLRFEHEGNTIKASFTLKRQSNTMAISELVIKKYNSQSKASPAWLVYSKEDFMGAPEQMNPILIGLMQRICAAVWLAYGLRKLEFVFQGEDNDLMRVCFILHRDVECNLYRQEEEAFIERLEASFAKKSEEKSGPTIHFAAHANENDSEEEKARQRLVDQLTTLQKERDEKQARSEAFWSGTGPALIGLGVSIAAMAAWAYRTLK